MTRVSQCLGMLGVVCALSATCLAQTVLLPQGSEFNPVGKMIGDQVHPSLALSSVGGYLVWEDNTGSDGKLVVKGVPLSVTSLALGSTSTISEGVGGDNQNARVAYLANGGKVVVWQGGELGFQKIYARFLSVNNDFLDGAIQVNTYTNSEQINPTVSVLKDGNVLVAWTSYGQDGDKGGVFARRLSPAGQFLGNEFQINQATDYNQRDASIAVLPNGNVIIAWISEQQNGPRTVDVYGRYYLPSGLPINSEFRINGNTNVCANPKVAPLDNGGFVTVWSQKDLNEQANSWDIQMRVFNPYGAPQAASSRVNTYTYGDQFGPQLAISGSNQIVIWTSLKQDGDWEGIFGAILDANGNLCGEEFRVNARTINRQIHPAVAANQDGQAVAVWSGFATGETAYDLYAQIYGQVATVVPRLNLQTGTDNWGLQWTTQMGASYQVQVSSDLSFWSNVGDARTASGETDSITLTALNGAAYYRVLLLK